MSLDRAVLDAVVGLRSAPLTAAMWAVTTVGNVIGLVVICALGMTWLWRRGASGWALWCGATGAGSWCVMNVSKVLFGRERPPVPLRLGEIDSLSFPSGHAMLSMTVLGALAIAAHAVTGRRWPIAAALAGSGVIGLSRVYLGMHWLTDVLAGWVFGAVIVAAALWLRMRLRRADHSSPR